MDIIVAVVDKKALKTGVGNLLDVDGYKGEIGREGIAALALLHWGAESDLGIVHFVVIVLLCLLRRRI